MSLSSHFYLSCNVMRASDIRGMTREEAELEFVIISQKMDGFGDEYYPAKVSTVNVYYGSNQVSRYQPYRHIISVGQFCQLGNFFFNLQLSQTFIIILSFIM